MEGISCARARQLLKEFQAEHRSEPMSVLHAHVRTCPSCQTALALIAASALSSIPTTINCQHCHPDLPAFIDSERSDQPGLALQRYPHVWWHLWTCAVCLEAYEMTRALIEAEQRGELQPPEIEPARIRPERRIHLLRLTRQFLNIALFTPQTAVARGSDDGPLVISAGPAPGGAHFTLSVEPERKGGWKVAVQVIPAPAGQLVLTLGEATFRARFDAAGLATVPEVPAALLSAVNGPDMAVDIVPEEAQ
jgi:hypothetical protein